MQDLELWYYQWKTLLALGIEKDYRAQEIIHKNQQMGLQPIQKLLQRKDENKEKAYRVGENPHQLFCQ